MNTVSATAPVPTVRRADGSEKPDAFGRVIAVGVDDCRRDAAALRWAATEARSGLDIVHAVHAFVPGPAGTPGRPDERFVAARGVARDAVDRLARLGTRVEGSAVAGLPEDVLHEFAEIVDLLVVGDDPDPAERTRKISWRISADAACPVVRVPSAYLPLFDARPVVLVVGPHGFDGTAAAFAFHWARTHDVALQVCHGWSAAEDGPDPDPERRAHRQEQLDLQLAELQAANPGVPVGTRIELAPDWAGRLAARCSLLIVPSADAIWLARSLTGAVRRACPVVTVPRALSDVRPLSH